MDTLRDLLKGRLPSFSGSVRRALLIAEAERWLAETAPELKGRMRVSSVQDGVLHILCQSSVVAHRTEVLGSRLLQHLKEGTPELKKMGNQDIPFALKCLVRGGNVHET